MAGEIRNKAISASNEVEVEVEAELGNIKIYLSMVSKKILKPIPTLRSIM